MFAFCIDPYKSVCCISNIFLYVKHLNEYKKKKNSSQDYFYLTSTSKDKLVTLVFVLSIVTERSHRNNEESI